jgi:hypothetical protein
LQPSSRNCVELCNSFFPPNLLPIKYHFHFNRLKIIFLALSLALLLLNITSRLNKEGGETE